jgi:acyl carrier protein
MEDAERKSTILSELGRIVRECWLDGPTAPQDVSLGPETRFVEDMDMDSLAVVETIIAAEDAFEIEIPDGEVDGIRTMQEAADYVERKVAGR